MQRDSTSPRCTGITLEDQRIGLLSCDTCGALWFMDLDDDGNVVGWPSCPRTHEHQSPPVHRSEGTPRHSSARPTE